MSCASQQNTKCHMDDAVGLRGKEEKKSQLLSQAPTQLEEPEVLKLKVYPMKVKEQAASPEVMENNGVLSQCAVVKNKEVCDTMICFQPMRPLYSWDRSSVSQ